MASLQLTLQTANKFPPPFALYSSGCLECDSTDNLIPCKCGVVFYCGPEHQRLEQKTHHKCCCRKILKARERYETAKKALTADQQALLQPVNILEIDPAYLVELKHPAFEKCLEERHALARALRAPLTRQGLEESTDHLRWNTLLRPVSLDLAAPRVVASYLIRANRDDECHEFLRQYSMSICRRKGWRSDMEMANDRSRDPLNDTDLLHSPFVLNEVLLFATLIKLRMLTDLEGVERINDAVTESIGHRLPLELLDYVQSYLHENPILAKAHRARRDGYKKTIVSLKAQIDRLWWEVRQRCKYLWPYLLDSRVLLRPECSNHNHQMGRTGCTFCNLKDMSRFHLEDAWKQSPGALEYISWMVVSHDRACLVSDDEFLSLRSTL